MPSASRELYLTFDDGPVIGPTEFALEQLSKVSIKATFFCIGDNVRKYPGIYKRVVDEGHTVGNHTFNHLNGWRSSTKEYLSNVKLFEDHLPHGFPIPKLFRPPYGKITRGQIDALQHYKIIMWDVLSKDYDRSLAPETCLRKTISAVRPGSIIVFHDSFKSEKNLQYVLPRFIDHFMERGYLFKAIPS